MNLSFSIVFTKRFWIAILILLVFGVFLLLRTTAVQVVLENLTPPNLPKPNPPIRREVLAQNWEADTTEQFHFISQGTGTLPIPYHWLLALEQPESSPWGLLWPGAEGRFVAKDYLERYGFISASSSKTNPDGLPVGFASSPFQNLAGYPTTTTAVGFTCAACHTGRLTYEGTEYIVNGGPAVTDLQVFTKGLGAALGQTLFSSKLPLPNKRFDRFAHNVLGSAYSKTAKARLAKALDMVVDVIGETPDPIEVVEGHGRLDALNRIGNQVFSKNIGRPENYAPINAPVNYPHIWTASWFDWVQYDGSIMQPLVRNSGEALGVHAAMNVTAPAGSGQFSSSIPVDNLRWIEQTLAGGVPPARDKVFGGLHGPKWPGAFGPIDTALAAQGEELYERRCQGCHLPPLSSDAIWDERYFQKIEYEKESGTTQTTEAFLALNIVKLSKIGTDPAQSNILAKRTVNTAANVLTGAKGMGMNATVCAPLPSFGEQDPQYASSKLDSQITGRSSKKENKLVEQSVTDGPMINFALALGAVVQQVNDQWFEDHHVPAGLRKYFEGERPNCLQSDAGYKARPLNGVWATAPFLHNGSVPTLDDLLRPADQRPHFVRLGDTTFDPLKVGVKQPNLNADSYPPYVDGYFILDTSLDGNRNTGHAFGASASGDRTGVIGAKLTDEERKAIIEYLKTL